MKLIMTFSEAVELVLVALWFIVMFCLILPILIKQWWESRKHKGDKRGEDLQ